jgi:hypothetical protein
VGFDWHPTSKEMYFTDNSRDWMSEDLPNDELNRMTKVRQHFGSPFCYQGNLPDQEFGWGHKCEEFVPPIALLGPHAAALGMKFYTGNSFPGEYKNSIFIARHGSWNKTNRIGGDVILANIIPHRLPRGQHLCGAAGRRDGHEGRLAAGLGRLERRGLAHQLWNRARCGSLKPCLSGILSIDFLGCELCCNQAGVLGNPIGSKGNKCQRRNTEVLDEIKRREYLDPLITLAKIQHKSNDPGRLNLSRQDFRPRCSRRVGDRVRERTC